MWNSDNRSISFGKWDAWCRVNGWTAHNSWSTMVRFSTRSYVRRVKDNPVWRAQKKSTHRVDQKKIEAAPWFAPTSIRIRVNITHNNSSQCTQIFVNQSSSSSSSSSSSLSRYMLFWRYWWDYFEPILYSPCAHTTAASRDTTFLPLPAVRMTGITEVPTDQHKRSLPALRKNRICIQSNERCPIC